MSLEIPYSSSSLTFDAFTGHQPSSPRKSERYTLEFEYQTVLINNETHKLRFISCLMNEKMGLYWYATYGFHDTYLYIFKSDQTDSDDRLHMELVGIVEPSSAKPNRNFRSIRHIERYFLNAYRE